MSKFYVGQRVRLVYEVSRKNYGREGQIVLLDDVPSGTICCDGSVLDRDCDCGVVYDGDSGWSCEQLRRLEPITDPGREVVSWETCEWKPEHLCEVPA